jgi:hypothetical protein
MAKGTIVESIKDALAVGSSVIESAKNEVVWLLSPNLLVFADQYDITSKSKKLIENGGHVKGVFRITSPYVELARSRLAIGEDVRHDDQYEGVFFLVADRTQSISSIHVNQEDLLVDDPVVAFWSEDSTYAEYLLSNFEQAWTQGVDAQERLQELLKEDPSLA